MLLVMRMDQAMLPLWYGHNSAVQNRYGQESGPVIGQSGISAPPMAYSQAQPPASGSLSKLPFQP